MFALAIQTATLFSAEDGSSYDIIPSGPFYYTAVATFMADELYPGRAVARVHPNGRVEDLRAVAA